MFTAARSSVTRSSIPALFLACLAFAALTAVAGCQTPPEEDEATAAETTEEELRTLPGVRPCGNKLCGPGMVCCNASCGICVRPGGFCTQQFCSQPPSDGVSAGGCETDADCRADDDYCGGCNCLALSAQDRKPVCKGAIVSCFARPCLRQRAVCEQGQCRLRANDVNDVIFR